MRNLGLLALLAVVAFAYSAFTWRGEQHTTPTASAGISSGLPVGFAENYSDRVSRKIRAVYNLEPADKFYSAPWPFRAERIYFACAEGMANVVGANGIYAALNGYTSTLANRYKLINDRGESISILGTSTNRGFRDAGLVRANAEDSAIGGWWGALNDRLRRDCP